MVSKATACLLIALTFISPSVCCCSLEAATSWVLSGVFQETGICQASSCCRQSAPLAASFGDQHQCERPAHADGHCDGSDDESHHCPCRDAGIRDAVLPSTLDLHAVTSPFSVNNLLQLYVVPMLAVCDAFDSSITTELSAPRGLCENGQGILRAYGRLRI